MEQLQFIIPKLSVLLKRDISLIRFHRECARLQTRVSYAMQILHALQTGDTVSPNDADIYIEDLADELTKISYIPEIISRYDFLCKLPEGVESCYDLYTWLLTNDKKVRLRTYLTNLIVPIDIPNSIKDRCLNKALANHKGLTEMFWMVRTLFSAAEKHAATSQEDINLKKRAHVQKLQNIRNDSSTSFGNMLYEVYTHGGKFLKEISGNTDIIKRMERTLSDYKTLEKYGQLSADTIIPYVCDVLNEGKILETVKNVVENDQFEKQVDLLKTEVEDLANQRIPLDISPDEELGPFLKRIIREANRKEVLLEKINSIRNKHMQLTNQLKLKEAELYKMLGKELYRGDNLKHFITELRNNSVVYNNHRVKLDYWTAELALFNRTTNALRSIESSISDVLQQITAIDQNRSKSLKINSIKEAKRLSKKILSQIETARVLTSETQTTLSGVRKEVSTLSEKLKATKKKSATTTKTVTTRVENLKEQAQTKKEQIEILEQDGKGTTQELDQLDRLRGRLADVALESFEDSPLKIYHDQLEKKKRMLQENLKILERMIRDRKNTKGRNIPKSKC